MPDIRLNFIGDISEAQAEIARLRVELQGLNREALQARTARFGAFAGTGSFLNEVQRIKEALREVAQYARSDMGNITKDIRDLEYRNRVMEQSIAAEERLARARRDAAQIAIQRLGPLQDITAGTAAFRSGQGPAAEAAAAAETRRLRQQLNQNLLQDSASYVAQQTRIDAQLAAERKRIDQELAESQRASATAKKALNQSLLNDSAAQIAIEKANDAARIESLASIQAAAQAYEKYAAALRHAQEAARTGNIAAIASLRSGQFGDQTQFLRSLEQSQGVVNVIKGLWQNLGQTHAQLQQVTGAAHSTAAAISRTGSAVRQGTHEFDAFTQVTREATVLFDEFMRGQRGAEVASIGAFLRRIGTPQLMAAAVPIGVAVGIERLTVNMAKLSEEMHNNATAVGMTVEQYSRFSNLMQVFGGNAQEGIRGLQLMSENMRQAIVNPASEAGGAFARLRISARDLENGLQDPVAFIDLLRQKFQALPNDMNRVEMMRAAIGRGFTSLIPILAQNNEEFAKWAAQIKATFTDEMSDHLRGIAQESAALQVSIKNLGGAIVDLAANYAGLGESIRHAVDALKDFINQSDAAARGTQELRQKGLIGGVLGGAVAGGIAGTTLGGPFGGVAGAIGGAVVGGAVGPSVAEAITPESQRVFTAPIPPPLKAIDPAVVQSIDNAKTALDKLNDARLKSSALVSDKATPGELEKELRDNQKIISERQQLEDAEFRRQVARAEGNAQQIRAIEQQRTAAAEASLQREAALQEAYANRLRALGQQGMAEQIQNLDNIEKRRIDIETAAIEKETQLRNQEFSEFSRVEENKLRASRGNWDAILAIIAEWRAKAAQIFAGHADNYAKALEQIRQKEIQQQEDRFRQIEENVTAQNRISDLQLRIAEASLQQQVAAHGLSKAQMAQQELALTQTFMAQEEERLRAVLNNADLTVAQQQKVYEQLAELEAKDAERQAQIQAKITADIEQENKRRVQALTTMFDSIGSTLENALVGALTGKPMKIQDFYKAIFTDVVKAGTSILSQLAGKAIAPTLGVKLSEGDDTSLGNVFGRALGSALGLTKDSSATGQAAITAKLAQAQADAAQAAKLLGDASKTTDASTKSFSQSTTTFSQAVDRFAQIIDSKTGAVKTNIETPSGVVPTLSQQQQEQILPSNELGRSLIKENVAPFLFPDQATRQVTIPSGTLGMNMLKVYNGDGGQSGYPTDITGNLQGYDTGGYRGYRQVPQNVPIAYNYLINNAGLTPVQAAGAVNWMYNVESGLNPTASNTSGGGHFGIAQWGGSRLTALRGQFGDSPTFRQQLEFLAQEIKGGDFGGPRFAAGGATTERQAFEQWGRWFERPRDWEFRRAQSQYANLDQSLLQRQAAPPPTQVAGETQPGTVTTNSNGEQYVWDGDTWVPKAQYENPPPQEPPKSYAGAPVQVEPPSAFDIAQGDEQFGPAMPAQQARIGAGRLRFATPELPVSPAEAEVGGPFIAKPTPDKREFTADIPRISGDSPREGKAFGAPSEDNQKAIDEALKQNTESQRQSKQALDNAAKSQQQATQAFQDGSQQITTSNDQVDNSNQELNDSNEQVQSSDQQNTQAVQQNTSAQQQTAQSLRQAGTSGPGSGGGGGFDLSAIGGLVGALGGLFGGRSPALRYISAAIGVISAASRLFGRGGIGGLFGGGSGGGSEGGGLFGGLFGNLFGGGRTGGQQSNPLQALQQSAGRAAQSLNQTAQSATQIVQPFQQVGQAAQLSGSGLQTLGPAAQISSSGLTTQAASAQTSATSTTFLGTSSLTAGTQAQTAGGEFATAGAEAQAGGGGGFGGIFGLIGGLFGLEHGGIIPSAADGMMVSSGGGLDGRGGRLAVVHPREMVLPASISTKLQNMMEVPSNDNVTNNSHYHEGPTSIALHTIDARSGAQFLMDNSKAIARAITQERRNSNAAFGRLR